MKMAEEESLEAICVKFRQMKKANFSAPQKTAFPKQNKNPQITQPPPKRWIT